MQRNKQSDIIVAVVCSTRAYYWNFTLHLYCIVIYERFLAVVGNALIRVNFLLSDISANENVSSNRLTCIWKFTPIIDSECLFFDN